MKPPNPVFPVGGPRQPVYNFLTECGFTMSKWSDKRWTSPTGMVLQLYGAGSMARVYEGDKLVADCPLGDIVDETTRVKS